jgi:hypothetical protein
MPECICGGPLVYLGTLGSLSWWRCRNCGQDHDIPTTDLDPEVLEAVNESEY